MSKKDLMAKLREQLETFKETGGKRTTEYSKKRDFYVSPKPEEKPELFRLMLFPDGDLFKEYQVIFKVNEKPVPGKDWPKDYPFLCPVKNRYGKSALQDFSQELWDKAQAENPVQPGQSPSGTIAKQLWSKPSYLFCGVVRGEEENGALIYPTTKDAWEKIMELVTSEEYEEDGGFFAEGNDKCLDLKIHSKMKNGYKMLDVKHTKKPKPLIPEGSELTLEELESKIPDPDEFYPRVSYKETEEILDCFVARVLKGDKPDVQKYENKEVDALDEKFKQLKGN